MCFRDDLPFNLPILVGNPPTASQATQEHSPSKFLGLRRFLRLLTSEHDSLTMEIYMRKKCRGTLDSGFSASHITNLVPSMVREVVIFCDILKDHTQQSNVLMLKKAADNLTLDIVGKVVL